MKRSRFTEEQITSILKEHENFNSRPSDQALRSSHSSAPVTDAPTSTQNGKTNRPSEPKIA